MEIKIVYMGTPALAIPPLEGLLEGGYEIVGVYTQPDRPVGRGRSVEAPPVKAFALERGLRVLQPRSLRSSEAREEMESLAPDLGIVVAYGRILPREILELPRWGCLNIHPSLLPRHRGPSPVAHTLLEGDTMAGVTVMLVDEGMDSGPILSQEEEMISLEDTAATLTDRLVRKGAMLLARTLPAYLRGELEPQPQDESQATYSRKLSKEDGVLRWELPAETLWRQVRAYTPWPGSYTHWRGRLLKVVEAVPLEGDQGGAPGTVVLLESGAPAPIGVITGDGILGLRRVQLEGRQVVYAEAFLRGHGGFVGSTLPC